jgi:hypothetical protein
MTVDNEYADKNDTLIVQWSVNGTSWFNLDTLTRYNPTRDKWVQVITTLPKIAGNQTKIFIAFQFTSAYGNDMHIDDINLEKIFPKSPRLVSSSTNITGTEVEISFDKEMNNPVGKQGEFVIENGSVINPLFVHLKSGDSKTYVLALPTAVKYGQTVKISYKKGTITSANGGILESFTNKIVANKVSNPDLITEIDKIDGIKVFPNPNTGEFEVHFDEKLFKDVEIKIYGVNGELVYQKNIGRISKDQTCKINLGSKLHGVYNILVLSGKNKFNESIVIQ